MFRCNLCLVTSACLVRTWSTCATKAVNLEASNVSSWHENDTGLQLCVGTLFIARLIRRAVQCFTTIPLLQQTGEDSPLLHFNFIFPWLSCVSVAWTSSFFPIFWFNYNYCGKIHVWPSFYNFVDVTHSSRAHRKKY